LIGEIKPIKGRINCGNHYLPKKKFPNIQAVIFDKDGTLADSRDFLRQLGHWRSRLIDARIPGVGEPLLMAFGIQDDSLDATGLMAVGSRRENEIAAAAYIAETGRSWFESLSIARSAFDEADQSVEDRALLSPLFPGTRELLQVLTAAGLKLGILSADSTAGVEAFVTQHQLGDYFQLSMGVDSAALTKPDPRLFHQACAALGVEPSATLMVGDSEGDRSMARKGGAAGVIAISWHSATASDLQGADVAIARLDEIKILNS